MQPPHLHLPVFVKIDTGRGRLGVNAEEFPDFTGKSQRYPMVEGVYSHMAAVNGGCVAGGIRSVAI